MVERRLLAPAVGAAVAAAAICLTPLFPPGGAVSTAVACGTVAGLAVLTLDWRRRLGWLLLVPGFVSLVATAAVLARGTGVEQPNPLAALEVAALLLILIHVTRWNRGWSMPVVAVVTAAAQILWLLRHMPGAPWTQQLFGCLFWALGSAVAIAFGIYPRWAANRLRHTVASAREAQQRQLERDLHDYVAHDLSGMIVQAQAARYAAAGDADALSAALRRIEEAGHRAMSSMDRALSLLRVTDTSTDGSTTRHPGLDELPDLVEQFDQGCLVPAELVQHGNSSTVPREVAEVLYRTASEALTNIRRHAGAGLTRVVVTLEILPRSAGITIVDEVGDADPTPAVREGGGTGLLELRDRVDALDGVFEAGPTAQGWKVAVRVPFTGAAGH